MISGRLQVSFRNQNHLIKEMEEEGNRYLIVLVYDDDHDMEGDVVVAPVKPELQKPPLYKVFLLNDPYTPMVFVVDVLRIFFNMDVEKAWQIMMAVHTTGKATCGIFTRDIAETKSAQVNQYAQEHQHPLVSDIEAID